MPFIIWGNETSPCAGVDSFNAQRPDIPTPLVHGITTLTIILVFLLLTSIPLMYLLRNDPIFYRIRPFPITTLITVAQSVAFCGYLLPHAFTNYPCWLELILHTLSSVVVVNVTTTRAFVFVIETRIAVLLQKDTSIAKEDDGMSVAGDEIKSSALMAFYDSMRLGYSRVRLKDLQLNDLVQIRNHFLEIVLLSMVPSVIIVVLCAATIQPYSAGCVQCPFYVESVVIALVPSTLIIPPFIRFTSDGYHMEVDKQYIMKELAVSFVICAPWIYVGYGLELGDPGLLMYNRQVTWRFVLSIAPFLFWIIYSVVPITYALVYRRKRKEAVKEAHIDYKDLRADFMTLFEENRGIKMEFYAFAASRYCVESLNFIEDIKLYKRECIAGQSERWKRNKVRKLVRRYIEENANQQVNISDRQRKDVLNRNPDVMNGEHLNTIFDEAYNEIIHMIGTGTWLDFRNEKKRAQKKLVIHSG